MSLVRFYFIVHDRDMPKLRVMITQNKHHHKRFGIKVTIRNLTNPKRKTMQMRGGSWVMGG